MDNNTTTTPTINIAEKQLVFVLDISIPATPEELESDSSEGVERKFIDAIKAMPIPGVETLSILRAEVQQLGGMILFNTDWRATYKVTLVLAA